MMLMSILSLIFSLSFSFPLLTQPISLGMTLLVFSLLVSTAVFFSSMTWFSFILFLIYIGGLLVMFAYVTALMPNLLFKKTSIFMFLIFSTMFWLSMLMLSEFIGIMEEINPKMNMNTNFNLNHLGVSLYSSFNFMVIVGLALILLFVLICVVKICYFSNAPLRPYKS
uniref:NADH dehydrogenase subunit 6 n=1 Tax=Acanthochitona defilippii TaxID=761903 RepID=UPI0030FEE458